MSYYQFQAYKLAISYLIYIFDAYDYEDCRRMIGSFRLNSYSEAMHQHFKDSKCFSKLYEWHRFLYKDRQNMAQYFKDIAQMIQRHQYQNKIQPNPQRCITLREQISPGLIIQDTIQKMTHLLSQSLKQIRNSEVTLLVLVQLYNSQRNYECSNFYYNYLIFLRPKEIRYYLERSKVCYKMKLYNKALHVIQQGLNVFDDQKKIKNELLSEFYVQKGLIFSKLGELKQAQFYLQLAIEKDIKNFYAYQLLIVVMLGQFRYQKIILYINQYQKLSQNTLFFMAISALAECNFNNISKMVQILSEMKEIISIYPQMKIYIWQYQSVVKEINLFYMRDDAKKIIKCQEDIENIPNYDIFLDAISYYRQKQFQSALKYLYLNQKDPFSNHIQKSMILLTYLCMNQYKIVQEIMKNVKLQDEKQHTRCLLMIAQIYTKLQLFEQSSRACKLLVNNLLSQRISFIFKIQKEILVILNNKDLKRKRRAYINILEIIVMPNGNLTPCHFHTYFCQLSFLLQFAFQHHFFKDRKLLSGSIRLLIKKVEVVNPVGAKQLHKKLQLREYFDVGLLDWIR